MDRKNNLLRGMGSVLNLFPQGKDITLPTHSDEEAYRKDLEQVGSDMRTAIKSVEKDLNDYTSHADSNNKKTDSREKNE